MLRFVSFLTCGMFFAFFLGCNPDEDDILGLELIEDDEFIIEKHQFPNESIDLIVTNFQEENISGSGTYSLLGSFNDQYFGQSDAAFFMQVLLPSNNIDFEADELTENMMAEKDAFGSDDDGLCHHRKRIRGDEGRGLRLHY